ncbi:MAG: RNA polymerase factor sigma-54 [Clostridiales bacterium]|nr:RNA polymerase factor sigma-54 [Clostridiales bacterium]
MRLGYDLTIEQSQKLVMTPELIQAIQILQFNTQELDSYVQDQLLSNPVLETSQTEEGGTEEERKSFDEQTDTLREYIRERGYDETGYKQPQYANDDKDYSYEQYVSAEITLPEHLMFQLQFASGNKTCRKIGRYIIESLDENGYMTLEDEEIAAAVETCVKNVKKVVNLIQTFEPMGVGARDLGQCLLIQLKSKDLYNEKYKSMITEHIEDLAGNRLGQIAKDLGISVKEVQEMSDVIKSLEPKPGRQFAGQTETRYIVPDVFVEKTEEGYSVTTNDTSIPKLMVSSYYEKVLRESGNDEKLNEYLSERFNSALWLIKSIEQRKQTIINVVTSIVKFQKEYFDNGDKYLKTLTLRQVADDVGIHESTVSRSINGKYMQSPRGVFELKYFFSGGVFGDQGEGISSNSIKTHIKEIIDKEDIKAPYSDQSLAMILKERGIEISRRTIAKYRDEMGISSSSKRKRY